MDKNVLDFVVDKTKEILAAPSCCKELKAEAQKWLDAVGTEKEAEETKKYIAEMEMDIIPVDALIAFTASEMGKKVFGDRAEEFHAHGLELKAKGEEYCDCPACSPVKAILEKKAEML